MRQRFMGIRRRGRVVCRPLPPLLLLAVSLSVSCGFMHHFSLQFGPAMAMIGPCRGGCVCWSSLMEPNGDRRSRFGEWAVRHVQTVEELRQELHKKEIDTVLSEANSNFLQRELEAKEADIGERFSGVYRGQSWPHEVTQLQEILATNVSFSMRSNSRMVRVGLAWHDGYSIIACLPLSPKPLPVPASIRGRTSPLVSK